MCCPTRYYSLLASGDKKGAYGLVAQLFDGMRLSDISKLCEECFQANVEDLVSNLSSVCVAYLSHQTCPVAEICSATFTFLTDDLAHNGGRLSRLVYERTLWHLRREAVSLCNCVKLVLCHLLWPTAHVGRALLRISWPIEFVRIRCQQQFAVVF